MAMRNRLVDRQLLLASSRARERLAFDERHDVVQQAVARARIEQREEVRVLEIRGDSDLAQESLDAEHGAELRIEDLERDEAVVLEIAREEDRRHAAATDLTLDRVAARRVRVQLRLWVQVTCVNGRPVT